MNPQETAAGSSPKRKASLRQIAAASLIGTTVEYYDFAIFSVAAALVFPELFFPGESPTAALLASFATFAVGFVARPVGGIVIGHFGDKIGRKAMLSLTLVAMGVATVGIGVLPGYAAIGVAAPGLLVTLRIVQGLAFGGEWAGAVLLAFEHAPKKRRGMFGSIPQMGPALGSLVGSLAFVLVGLLPREDLISWGWRLPFLAGGLLVIVGLVIRLRVEETPDFTESTEKKATPKVPVLEVLRSHRLGVLLVIGLNVGVGFGAFTYTTYLLSWAPREHGVPTAAILTGVAIGNVIQFVGIPFSGQLADRFGRARVYGVGAALLAAAGFVAPTLLSTGDAGAVILAYALAYGLGFALMMGVVPALVADAFSVEIRYTGMSLGFQVAQAIAGFTPTILAALVVSTGTIYVAPVAVAVLAVVSASSAWGLDRRRRAQQAVSEPDPAAGRIESSSAEPKA